MHEWRWKLAFSDFGNFFRLSAQVPAGSRNWLVKGDQQAPAESKTSTHLPS
jgi:hypothetical protein